MTTIRPAVDDDLDAVAEIFNQGISERVATFETRTKDAGDIRALLENGQSVLVAESDGVVVGFAKIAPYEARSPYYSGIGEATVYVARDARRLGAGRELLAAAAEAARADGRHKLLAKVFASNEPSLGLFEKAGYRRVGVHERHAQLDGEWRDVVLVELHLAA